MENWPRIAVIGAGISGICAGIMLSRAGYKNVVITEKMPTAGGTWRDNVYPGAACDIPSHLYSFSFAPKDNWSQTYASQSEILGYLEDCVDRFGISSLIRYGAEVVSAHYVDSSRHWRITLADDEVLIADIMITACGQLHRPNVPNIDGMASFVGQCMHSAQWQPNCDFAGRRVALIGSAASAVQIATAIADDVGELIVFQRTPNWIGPRFGGVYSNIRKSLMRRVPLARKVLRSAQFVVHEALFPAFRPGSWMAGLLMFAIERFMRRKIRKEALIEPLLPTYPVGCKRVLLSRNYLKLFRRDNVVLVTQPISHFCGDGIVTINDDAHKADIAIFATGFRTSEMLAPMDIRGAEGYSLNDAWALGPSAYLGMAVPEFPNMFMLYGPNTSLAHNSMIFMIERQVNYIRCLLDDMRRTETSEIMVRKDVWARFDATVQQKASASVWGGSCSSWYKSENGRVIALWPFSTVRYWWLTRRADPSDYVMR